MMDTHQSEQLNPVLSRRRFLARAGVGLVTGSLVTLAGCPNGRRTVVPEFTPVAALRRPHPQRLPQPTPPVNPSHPWAPNAGADSQHRWQAIVVHHTATPTGSAAMIDDLHRRRGFDGLGYDFIINNGQGNPDGLVEVGYRWQRQITGAHCRPDNCADNYWNEHTIGIALIGNFEVDYPSQRQYASLSELVRFLQQRYAIADRQLWQHNHVPGSHTKCPGRHFSMQRLGV